MQSNFNQITSHHTTQTSAWLIGLWAVMGWIDFCLPTNKFRINFYKKHIFSLQQRLRPLLIALIFGVACLTLAGPASGAISLEQNLGSAALDTTAGTSIQVTAPTGVAVGNTVIVTFAMDEAVGTVSCADQGGNTYTKDVDQKNANNVRTVIFSANITTALSGGDWIRVTHPSIADRVMQANEFSGLASSAYDRSASKKAGSTSMTSNSTSTTSEAVELLIGAIGVAGPIGDTFTPTVETPVWNKTEVGTSNNTITLNSLDRIVTSTGAYPASGSNSVSRSYAACIATYKGAPASVDQAHYRWREDDDNEALASWLEDEDTNAFIGKGSVQRLRFLVENEGSQSSGAMTYQLQVAETATCSSGSYSGLLLHDWSKGRSPPI
jgi:hypothetical protein